MSVTWNGFAAGAGVGGAGAPGWPNTGAGGGSPAASTHLWDNGAFAWGGVGAAPDFAGTMFAGLGKSFDPAPFPLQGSAPPAPGPSDFGAGAGMINVHLLGSYMANAFVDAGVGLGGPFIGDPTEAQQNTLATPHH